MQEKSKEECEDTEGETWADDQNKRSYYYDDAHGYQEYVDDEAEVEEQNDEKQTPSFN
jgi:hypothetical protein